jgi:ribulose-phosphate 3-epimerase
MTLTKDILIYPSILAADMRCLGDECKRAEDAGVDGLHVDIMDGQFVKNISMGFAIIGTVKSCVSIPVNVHTMILRPDWYVEHVAKGGACGLNIHIEAPCPVKETLLEIRKQGMRAGITLNPDTPVSDIEGVLNDVDEVLIMSVHPGWGGQSFIEPVLEKLKELRERKPLLDLSIDGGINAETGKLAAAAGANILYAGTSLFRADDMAQAVTEMRNQAQDAFNQNWQG